MEVDYTYDSAGRQATVTYPGALPTQYATAPSGPITYTYTYDAMGRPASLTDNLAPYTLTGANVNWVQNVQYDFAGRLSGWQHYYGTYDDYYYNPVDVSTKEARQYNTNGQMSSLTWSFNSPNSQNSWSTPAGIQYVYSGTQNNGQITQAIDALSGETITYQYDALKRLTSASSSSATPWAQTFQYDGFGNLTAKVLNGTTTPIPVTAATNRLTNAYYDANGNMTSGGGASMAYDEANRISAVSATSGGTEYYGYAADNKRVYWLGQDRSLNGPTEHIIFYGSHGEKLGVFWLTCTDSSCALGGQQSYVWFAGKMIWESTAYVQNSGLVMQDRLGTNRGTGARFYPYGDEITSTANQQTKFATYNRDSCYEPPCGPLPDIAGSVSVSPDVCFEPQPPPPVPDCADSYTTSQIKFVSQNYAPAAAEAGAIQTDISSTGVQINQSNVVDAFLDWSAWESGWDNSNIATKNHNYFGASPGSWGGTAGTNCTLKGFACWSASVGWGAELADILNFAPHSTTNPNLGNATYVAYLELALINNANASPAVLIQAIANAGFNSVNKNYGQTIAGPAGINIQPIIDCLKRDGRI